MELKVNEIVIPERIIFNYEELKQELTEKVSMYETMVYTDDQIKMAKADKANLNKLKNALNDERIRREKEYMIPFNEFKSQINEIISIIDFPVAVIDKQVKEFEEKQKQEKLDAVIEYFNQIAIPDRPDWLHFAQIMNEKWLNASTSMKSIQNDIDSKIEQIRKDIAILETMPEFGFEAIQVYKSSLDVNKALLEAHRMSQIAKAKAEAEAKAKAEAEAKKVEAATISKMEQVEPQPQPAPEGFMNPPVESIERQWISFKVLLSYEEALELKQFCNSRNIEIKAV